MTNTYLSLISFNKWNRTLSAYDVKITTGIAVNEA